MYGSFIPALSEHHSGGVNVGRALINGERLGGTTIPEQYFRGSQFARDLRARSTCAATAISIAPTACARSATPRWSSATRSPCGGCAKTVPQERIFAMRTTRAVPMGEITRRTSLTAREVQRFNPALTRQVPAGATIYLPTRVPEFGADVSFWQREPTAAYAAALDAFLELESGRASAGTTRRSSRCCRRTAAASRPRAPRKARSWRPTLAYVIGDLRTSRRAEILRDFRSSGQILQLFRQGVAELASALTGGQ